MRIISSVNKFVNRRAEVFEYNLKYFKAKIEEDGSACLLPSALTLLGYFIQTIVVYGILYLITIGYLSDWVKLKSFIVYYMAFQFLVLFFGYKYDFVERECEKIESVVTKIIKK